MNEQLAMRSEFERGLNTLASGEAAAGAAAFVNGIGRHGDKA
jgi:hypothetical protein